MNKTYHVYYGKYASKNCIRTNNTQLLLQILYCMLRKFLFKVRELINNYTGVPIVGIARWSVPRIGQGHLEVKW